MSKTLYYFPLESYAARYTRQLSAYKTGWYERNWLANGIEFVRVDHTSPDLYRQRPASIETGVVLDASLRSIYCLQQIEYFVRNILDSVEDEDVLFFDDFWTPGIEALKYTLRMKGKAPKFACFCWAQSSDQYDFMAKMRPWVLEIERGFGTGVYDAIFVANSLLKACLVSDRVAPHDRIHVVGLPFDSAEVRSRCDAPLGQKGTRVVYSSRLDDEKNPMFFLKLVESAKKGKLKEVDPATEFVLCTSHRTIRSNNPKVVVAARDLQAAGMLRIAENLSVEDYYRELAHAKVQFNCAYQDWVSFTLLEAVTFGCVPVYPYFRSFPETLGRHYEFFYRPENAVSAAETIGRALTDDTLYTPEMIDGRRWIVERYDDTWVRILNKLGVRSDRLAPVSAAVPADPYQEGCYRQYRRVSRPIA